jgi:hypothetical protein
MLNRSAARALSWAALCSLAATPIACGGKDKPAANASFSLGGDGTAGDGGAPDGSSPTGAPLADGGAPAPLGSVYTTDPNQLGQLAAGAAAAASAWFGPGGPGDPAVAALQAEAAKSAPGMSPEGEMAKGQLQEGGHIAFLVTMQPGRCYTIVGYGAGLQDLDLNLLAPPFYNLLAAQDGMNGPAAVIGKGKSPMCPALPIAVPYKVDVFAQKGAGSVAVQVYSKAK